MKASGTSISRCLVFFSFIGALASGAHAQTPPITPASDGTNTRVTPHGSRYDIQGGSLSKDGANLFHSFQKFGLSQGQIANFLSNPSIRNILGRVTGGEASIINGLIQVTGGNSNLFLMNPAGIIFGQNASLNVPAAFTATTATGIGFNSGWFNASGANDYAALVGTPSAFTFGLSQTGAIVNAGNLTLKSGNNLNLIGGTVINTGTLSSPGGNITIAAVPGENTVRISQEGHLLNLEIAPNNSPPQALIANPQTLPELLTGSSELGNATGVAVNEKGEVFLTGSGMNIPTSGGSAIASGTIDASGQTAGAVNVLGDKVGLIGSHINASGSNSGGTVLIGGDYQGKGAVPNATRTFVSSDSAIDASALDNGNGGKIIIWADKDTAFYGNINALGGTNGGNGGFVEVSGKENLIFRGSVNLSAANGTTGSLLLDPENITIVAGSGAAEDSEVSSDSQVLFGDGTTTYTISETALESLDGNAEVKLEASNDITIQPLSDSQLTLAAGMGSITFTADADKNGVGAFSMSSTDTIRAEGRNVTISAARITLGNIDTSSAASNGGAITLNALSDIVTGSLRSSAGGSGNGGAIALTSSSGGVNTTAGTLDSSSVNGNGGFISLTAYGDIKTGNITSASVGEIISSINEWGGQEFSSNGGGGTGGNITLTSNSGVVDTTAGNLLSYSLDGNGGNITFTAVGNINTSQLISSSGYLPPTTWNILGSGKGNGGNIALNSSSGAVDTFSGRLDSSSIQGDGGSVAITAYGNINTYSIKTSTSYSDWTTQTWMGGKGGNITLNSSNEINATQIDSYGGNGGSIALTAAGDIKVGNIFAGSFDSATGGNITLNSGGEIDANWLTSYSRGNGGSIALTAAGGIKVGGIQVSSYGSGTGGNIAINSGNAIVIGSLGSFSYGGYGGSITLSANGSIITRGIYSNGGKQGGNISLTSNYSDVDISLGILDATSEYGMDGNVTIKAYAGNIAFGNVSGSGNITVASGGIDEPFNTNPDAEVISDADKINNLSGKVSLFAHNDITVNEPIVTSSISNLELQAGRSININADIDTSGSNGNINLLANSNGADLSKRNPGAGSVIMVAGTTLNAGSGNIRIVLGTLGEIGNVTLSNLRTVGNVSVNAAGGNILHAGNNSLITAGSAVFQTSGTSGIGLPTEPIRIRVNNLEARAGSGGAFFDSPNRGVTVGGVTEFMRGISTGSGGAIALSANGDIFVTEPISTSVFSGNSGNITLNASGAIDSTTSELSSYSRQGDAGSVNLTASGDITTSVIKSFSETGSGGNITLNSGGAITTHDHLLTFSSDRGDGGSVSLTAVGDIRILTIESYSGISGGRGGNIILNSSNGAIDTTLGSLSSRSHWGDGGAVTLTAAGDIGIGWVVSSSSRGNGGNIILNSGGSIETIQGRLISYSLEGNGGDVSLTANGNITLDGNGVYFIENPIAISSGGLQKGGNISLTSLFGNIDSSRSNLNSYSENGTAGNVTLKATAGNVITRSIDSEGALQGGHINLISGSTINTTAGTLNSYSQNGTAGDVTLEAVGQVNTGGDSIASGIRTDGYLQGGDITITSHLSFIDTSRGNLDTHSTAGKAGIITLNAYSDIITSSIRSDGQIRGGAINITSNSGAIALGGTLDSYSFSGSAGNLTLSSPGSITLIGDVTSYGNTESGDVSITSSNNNVTTSAITTQSGTGPSGNIIINGKNIESGNISSIGTLGSGNIQVTATDGSVTTENIQTVTEIGNSGNVEVDAKDDINTGDQTSSSGDGNSGNIDNNAGGNQNTGNQTTTTPNGNSGAIANNVGGNQTTGDRTSSSGNGNSGNIDNNVGGHQNTGNQTTTTPNGNSGAIANNVGGNQTTGDQTSSSGNGTSGDILNTVSGNQTTGNQTTHTASGNSGNINNNVGGNQTTGNQTTSTNNGNAGSIGNDVSGNQTTGNLTSSAIDGNSSVINNTVGGNQSTGDQISSASNGDSGNINNSVGGYQTTGNQSSNASNGDSGNINNSVAGNQITGNQTSIAIEGNSGNITNTAGGGITTGDQISSALAGNSGNITNTAGGDITVGNIRSEGTNGAGDIAVNSTGGAVTTGNLESLSSQGNAGNITVDALNDAKTGDISSVGGKNSGDINVTSREGAIATGDIQSTALNGTAGDINLSAENGINTGSVTSVGALGNGRININNSEGININNQSGEIQTGEAVTEPGQATIAGTVNNVNARQLLANSSVANINAFTTALATDSLIEQMETARLQEYADYLGEEAIASPIATGSVRSALSTIAQQTGIQSGIVYVTAHSEQLEIVLFTAQGQPIRKTLSAANRSALLKMVVEFRDRLTHPRERNTTSYLKSAQQLYQWLIAPIESELQANGIDTLLFSMDSGLRSLPLAALHDGQQFLIEKYSLGLIPSVSLMDTRYQSLQKNPLLAMGASQFASLEPLPAVPVELQAIAQKREGQTFLNEEFTLKNLKSQRDKYAYEIIHLATHAEFLPGAVSNSYIQLWDEKLRLNQLRQLKFNNPSVELLVLSACRTALGDEKAEMGFAGLAVLSGVKSALASLWYVSDIGTLGLMEEFYSHLGNAPIKAEALREAQLAMIRGIVRIEDGSLRGSLQRSNVPLPKELAELDSTNLSHPYYWAGFTMIGSPW